MTVNQQTNDGEIQKVCSLHNGIFHFFILILSELYENPRRKD